MCKYCKIGPVVQELSFKSKVCGRREHGACPRGRYSHLFFIHRLWLSIYPSPHNNIMNFKHPKNIELLATQKKHPPFYTSTLRRKPKMHRNDPYIWSNFVMTPKNIHKIFVPQKIFIFLKIPKNIEIQNFEPLK